MKPFLGIDITTNRKNERLNGNEFLILKPSEILSQTLAKTTEQKDVIIQKSKMPLLLRIIKSICLFLAFICVSALLRARVSLAEAYHNAPWVFWLLPICVILFVLLTIEQNRCAMACQGCGAVLFLLKKQWNYFP